MAQKPATTRIPRQLRESDVHGKGAAEIGWGTPGDFDRCRAFMRRHDVPGHEIDGACANLHRIATGEWPGRNAHKGHLATAAVISLTAAAAPDPSKLIHWEGPLALVGEATGDGRHFPHDTLEYQTFPMPYRFQRQGLPGHQGSVTVGVIEDAKEQPYPVGGPQTELAGKRVVWGHGYFLDPDIVPEVKEAVHHAEHGVGGPSVDLDSYTAVLSKTMSGKTVASMRKGRMRAATQVAVPAFANLRITVMRPKALVAASSATFAVNSSSWHGAPIAPREALFDADDAAKRIEGWANGDPAKMASMFLWIADSPNAPLIGRKGYRLPWGDIIEGKPYLIYHAVYAAAALLQGAHGGLPAVPEEDKAKLRTVISSIYEELATEYGDDSIVAPWDNAQQQQASGELAWNEAADVDEYDFYVSCFTAALEEFVRHHRYNEAKHPRDKRKDDHAGEWIDTPHGPHGQIKVGSKWIYPPKRGEKGYKDPEGSARGIAKRGGGKPGGKSETKRAPSTHVTKKASPDKGSSAKKRPAAAKSNGPERGSVADHMEQLRMRDRTAQRAYLRDLDNEEIDKLLAHVGGRRLEDDTREDLETEIIHQVNKGDKGDNTDAKRIEDQKRAQRLRAISHGGGSQTVVAKKKPEPKKAPAAKTTTVAKKTGQAKEHKVTAAQLKALESLRDDPNAKVHPATRKVLEREGYIDSDGKLTDKGRSHVGAPKGPEPKKAPAAPVAKTTVVKKTGQPKEHKLTAAQQGALKSLGENPDAKVHPATRKVLQREGYIDSDGKLTDKGAKAAGVDTPKAPSAPVVAKKVAAPKAAPIPRLSDNQKDHLLYLRNGGNPAFVDNRTLKSLESKGLIDSGGKLTDEGKRVADHLDTIAPKPKPVTVTPAPKAPSGAPRLGDPGGQGPRPVPPDLPKLGGSSTGGPLRTRTISQRQRDLEDAEQTLATVEANHEEWTKSWQEGLEAAKRSGDSRAISYYQDGLAASKARLQNSRDEIARIKARPHDPEGYDKPSVSGGLVGTPSQEDIARHVGSITSSVPPQLHKQIHGQLIHQGSIAPRSMSTLRLVSVDTSGSDEHLTEGINAYYAVWDRRIAFNGNWMDARSKQSSQQWSYSIGWYSRVEDGTVGIEGTTSHEFGHHVAFRALDNPDKQKLLKAIVDEYDLTPSTGALTDGSVERAIKDKAAEIKDELSEYGTSSLQEFLADIWREFTNGGTRTRPKTRRIALILRQLAEEAPI
jgi:hypothetical protein